MHHVLARILLTLSAVILMIGGFVHGASFPQAQVALAGSGLSAHLVAAFKMLWLADSTTLVSVALIFIYVSLRPNAVPRAFVLGVSLIPAATTTLLFVFLGAVSAAVMLTVSTTAALCGAFLLSETAAAK